MGTRGMRGGYEGYEGYDGHELGTNTQDEYKGYEVGMRGTRWV